jgi:hypothetical protein
LHNLLHATGDGFRSQVLGFLLLGVLIMSFAFLGVIFCLDFKPFFFFPCIVAFLGVFPLFIYLFIYKISMGLWSSCCSPCTHENVCLYITYPQTLAEQNFSIPTSVCHHFSPQLIIPIYKPGVLIHTQKHGEFWTWAWGRRWI